MQKSELTPGAQIQLGNVTLKFSPVTGEGATDQISELPWIEQQHLLLSLVQALNSTLVLSQVLEQVLDAVMQITRAERGFLLLVEGERGRATATPWSPACACTWAAGAGPGSSPRR